MNSCFFIKLREKTSTEDQSVIKPLKSEENGIISYDFGKIGAGFISLVLYVGSHF